MKEILWRCGGRPSCFRHENSARDEDDKVSRTVAGGRRHQQIVNVIETHFSPALVEWARNTAQWDQSECSTARFVYKNVLNLELVTTDVHVRTPESIEDLVSAISPVFNASTTARIAANLKGFDAIAGIECSKGFIAQKFIWDWICHIIEQLYAGTETVDDSPELASLVPTKTGYQSTEGRRSSPSAENQTGPPETAGSHFVYHGTSAHYNPIHWPRYFTGTPFDVLGAFTTANQMGLRAVPGLFTAFSPLRALLWAAFKGHVPCMTPSVTQLGHMQQPWFCNGAFYRGVVLFQFHCTQPSVLTSYTIPAGKEKAWGGISQGPAAHCTSLNAAWEQFNAIHGEGRGKWPDVIHGLEYGPELDRSDTTRINLWRTMWTGYDGPIQLNSQHAATFAVYFELVGPNMRQQPISHKAGTLTCDDDRQEKGDGRGWEGYQS
ncbi:hypothetical protein CSOJ01_05665 [Colletotrichum sojae]|uniref:Uncharacterized protein n=1 Tax=Colletotrichum sojae TaxID=2175907 RepID=A0A8H6MWG2_9PEZI|nr:hypothetical protein CSOJ01_05665 [Colletotrichum sojae]